MLHLGDGCQRLLHHEATFMRTCRNHPLIIAGQHHMQAIWFFDGIATLCLDRQRVFCDDALKGAFGAFVLGPVAFVTKQK